jgi:hypothetical protein
LDDENVSEERKEYEKIIEDEIINLLARDS